MKRQELQSLTGLQDDSGLHIRIYLVPWRVVVSIGKWPRPRGSSKSGR